MLGVSKILGEKNHNRDRVKIIIFIRTNSNPADTDIFWHWLYSPELQDSQQLDKQTVLIMFTVGLFVINKRRHSTLSHKMEVFARFWCVCNFKLPPFKEVHVRFTWLSFLLHHHKCLIFIFVAPFWSRMTLLSLLLRRHN